jgi:hypothetical protein
VESFDEVRVRNFEFCFCRASPLTLTPCPRQVAFSFHTRGLVLSLQTILLIIIMLRQTLIIIIA